MTLHEFRYNGKLLQLKNPIQVYPQIEEHIGPDTIEGKRVLHLTIAELGIDLFCDTRKELELFLPWYVHMIWRRYALAEEEKLSEYGRKLKVLLLKSLEEIRAK
jgi:hypothetical protein